MGKFSIKNITNKIKSLVNKTTNETIFEMIDDGGRGFYAWDGKIYKSDIVRACIRPKVKAIGKSVPQHIRAMKDKEFVVNPEPYIRFLYSEPNPYMSGVVFREKMATQLCLNNNAFALIVRDENGYPIEMYNIQCWKVEAIYDSSNRLYLRFLYKNGKTDTFPYSDIIHLRQDVNENAIFGESPKHALRQLMEVVATTDQGIVNAIKNSGVIKWLIKFTGNMRREDIEKETKRFADSFLGLDNNVGAAGVDSKADAQQIDPKDYVPNASIIDKTMQRLFSFFNTNSNIVQSNYNEDQWNAYYESEIEPILLQWSEEDTRKLFSRRERGFGNEIQYSANNLSYASMKTKLGLVQFVDRGMMSRNETRRILNLPPTPGGDEMLLRKDTGVVAGEGESLVEGGNE